MTDEDLAHRLAEGLDTVKIRRRRDYLQVEVDRHERLHRKYLDLVETLDRALEIQERR